MTSKFGWSLTKKIVIKGKSLSLREDTILTLSRPLSVQITYWEGNKLLLSLIIFTCARNSIFIYMYKQRR